MKRKKTIIPSVKINQKNKVRQSIKAGLPPGTLIYVGKERTTKPVISLYGFDGDKMIIKDQVELKELALALDHYQSLWVNVEGVHDIALIKQIGDMLGLHKLTQEDIVNTIQRPKWDDYDEYGFTSIKMLYLQDDQIYIEQVSMVLIRNGVITFQEQKEDVFDSIRERLNNSRLSLRSRGADYLYYALIDVIISHYFICLEKLEDQISNLRQTIYEEAPSDFSFQIQQVSDELINLKKIIMPLRNCVSQWGHDDNDHIDAEVKVFFSDLRDQILMLIDNLDSYRDIVNNLQNLHFTLINHQMNDITKTLTVIATLFIPLTFIVGIYGMNFEYMPELGWRYGYFTIWGVMLGIVVGMLMYFRKKRWI